MKKKGFTERMTILMTPEMVEGLNKLAEKKLSDPSKIIRSLVSKEISKK